MRRFAESAFVGAFLVATLGLNAAAAQSCYSMQAEMLQLQSLGVGNPGDGDRYERAYREQADVIDRTEMRARSNGCFGGGFFFFRRAPDASCAELIPKLQQMQDNLARLDHLRRIGGSDQLDRMNELKGMMSSRGCDIPNGARIEATPDDNWYFQQNPYAGGGTYRTLCVRTCDGYYFPISFSTTSDRFPDDARTCQAMCPGAEAQLFYHDNPGGGPETMVSMSGVSYTALPTAFQYRTSLKPNCTCQQAGGMPSAALSLPQSPAPATPADLAAPPPRPRPAPGEDPETLADRAGDFVPRAGAPAAATGTLASSASGHPIRIVGPPLGNADQDSLVITAVPN